MRVRVPNHVESRMPELLELLLRRCMATMLYQLQLARWNPWGSVGPGSMDP